MSDWEIDENHESADHFKTYSCAYCGEPNEILIDYSIGKNYDLVEDCGICCRPNIIHHVRENGQWECWATPENE